MDVTNHENIFEMMSLQLKSVFEVLNNYEVDKREISENEKITPYLEFQITFVSDKFKRGKATIRICNAYQ